METTALKSILAKGSLFASDELRCFIIRRSELLLQRELRFFPHFLALIFGYFIVAHHSRRFAHFYSLPE